MSAESEKTSKIITRAQKKHLLQYYNDYDNFRPTHRSTEAGFPFTPKTTLTRSPPKTKNLGNTLPEAPKSAPVSSQLKFDFDTSSTAISHSPNIQLNSPDDKIKMADTTIQEANTAGRTPAIPKFLCPPIFNPATDNPLNFIRCYERCAAANGWDNILKMNYFGSFLDGAAVCWYNKFVREAENLHKTWKTVTEDFCKEFGGDQPLQKMKFKFNIRTQKETESIKEYFYDLLYLAEEVQDDMPFENFRDKFENGLHPLFHENYYLLCSANMTMATLKSIVFKLHEIRERAMTNEMTKMVSSLSLERKEERHSPHNTLLPPKYQQRRSYNNQQDRGNDYRNFNNGHRPSFNQSYRKFNNNNYNNSRNFQLNNKNVSAPPTRTADNRPRCYKCNRIGHYAGSCRINAPHNYENSWRHPNEKGQRH